MKHILTLIAVAVSFTFGACSTKQTQCTKSDDKCHGKPAQKCCGKPADKCCSKGAAKKK